MHALRNARNIVNTGLGGIVHKRSPGLVVCRANPAASRLAPSSLPPGLAPVVLPALSTGIALYMSELADLPEYLLIANPVITGVIVAFLQIRFQEWQQARFMTFTVDVLEEVEEGDASNIMSFKSPTLSELVGSSNNDTSRFRDHLKLLAESNCGYHLGHIIVYITDADGNTSQMGATSSRLEGALAKAQRLMVKFKR